MTIRSIVIVVFVAVAQSLTAQTITPGTSWKDSSGSTINAHGGCVVWTEGYFYWFGEKRSGNKSDGISCYRSADLKSWKSLGRALTPTGTKDDETYQDVAAGRTLERPKVMYNPSTQKWVMWIHWEDGANYGKARVAVCEADKVEGPYRFVSTFRPNNHDSRDQTIYRSADGTAYHLCATGMNTDINVVRITDDGLSPSAEEIQILKGRRLEAPAVFGVGETTWSLFSECDGWNPTPGHTASVVGNLLGPWTEGASFCIDAPSETSYKSQSAFVFSAGPLGYDPKCFVYMGDRWNSSNVESSTYVWLPLSVRSGYPAVRNFESWTPAEQFAEMYRYKRAASIEDGGTYSLLERTSDRLVSRKQQSRNGFCLQDDNDELNYRFCLEATDDPYVWRFREAESGQYLCSIFGAMRLDSDGTKAEAQWLLELEADGYYHIVNQADGKLISVSGGAALAGTQLYLNDRSAKIPQSFAFYFDSHAQHYAEADLYSQQYRDSIAVEMQHQEAWTSVEATRYTGETEYFSLQGVRVTESAARQHRGVYVRRSGNVRQKIVIP
ncbi:MAG: RICIN domain-containing protein [Bacteroidaceae bacterium]|nr:RICIN domain-containing protein [Bacteroidaceae bacterium]